MGGDQLTGGVELTFGDQPFNNRQRPTEAAMPVYIIRLLTWPTEAAMPVYMEEN